MIALVALLVLLLFLFPVKVGSFQSTHGPISTLEKSYFGLLLCSLMLVSAVAVLPMLSALRRSNIVLWQQSLYREDAVTFPIALRC